MSKDIIKQIDYKTMLETYNVLPFDNWKQFLFTHDDSLNEDDQINFLKKQLGHSRSSHPSGLYAYKMGEKWLYIGKGDPIFNRLKSHYRASFKPVSGDTENKRWYKFFSTHTGDLTIYWITVEGETTRKILELALHAHCKPLFEDFR